MSASDTSFGSQEESLRIGTKLREAREKLGLSVDDVSQAIKIQSTAVRQIDNGQFDKLGPTVFAKGFMRSYAKHVKLGQAWLDDELEKLALNETPVLLPSRGERLERSTVGERGMLAASYLVGTVILVSAIFLVTQFDRIMAPRGLEKPASSQSSAVANPNPPVSPANTPVVVNPAPIGGAPSVLTQEVLAVPNLQPTSVAEQTLPAIASLSEVNSVAQAEGAAVAAGIAALPTLPTDSQALELTLSGTAWVEISDSTGRRLEFNNLSAGVRKSYSGKAPFLLKIGNASKAVLLAGGNAIDLNAFTSASVAKLRLIERDGSLTAVALEPRAQ